MKKEIQEEADVDAIVRAVRDSLEGTQWIECDTSSVVGMTWPYGHASRTIPAADPIPEGWHRLGEWREPDELESIG